MECKAKQRLIEEYFDAFTRQKWIRQRLDEIRVEGDPESVRVAEQQAELAAEECYDAWRTVNEHECSEQCEE